MSYVLMNMQFIESTRSSMWTVVSEVLLLQSWGMSNAKNDSIIGNQRILFWGVVIIHRVKKTVLHK